MTAHKRKSIAYYITPHGFGHAVRSLEIIRWLLEMEPQLEIELVTDLPDFLVTQNVGRMLPMRRKRLDVGLVQIDSLRFDLDRSLDALESLFDQREELVADEVEFLQSHNVGCVVSDISFLAFAASRQCDIPAIGISNFTWDWIYRAYARSDPRWSPLVAWIRDCYSRCDLFLQLPMHGDCSACPRIEDVPLVARRAGRDRAEARRTLGLDGTEKGYLISFADLHLSPAAQARIAGINEAAFYYQKPLDFNFPNGRSLDGFGLSYTDVVAAVDAVVTKPGYGIVADCLAHGTPMIYADRGPFPEYEILVDTLRKHLSAVHIPAHELYSGDWEPYLRELEKQPRRIPGIPTNGAEVCARTILRFL